MNYNQNDIEYLEKYVKEKKLDKQYYENCLKQLYSMIGSVLTPKSPTPIYKKRSKDE